MRKLFLQIFILVSTLNLLQASNLNIIKFEKAKELFETKSALFVDARGEKLYKKGTILGSLNITTNEFEKKKIFLPIKKDATIVSYCNGFKCEKSDELAELLIKEGYSNVLVYKGGYPEWKEKAMPLMSLYKEEVKSASVSAEPKGESKTLNGAKVFLGSEKGMIDQAWFATVVLDKLPANVQLVDVRKASDFKDGHLPGAIHVPWDSKAGKIDSTKLPKDELSVFYCNTGMQSSESALSLKELVGKSVLYFDANVKCEGTKCEVEANEDL